MGASRECACTQKSSQAKENIILTTLQVRVAGLTISMIDAVIIDRPYNNSPIEYMLHVCFVLKGI